jgi:hypothetical protein
MPLRLSLANHLVLLKLRKLGVSGENTVVCNLCSLRNQKCIFEAAQLMLRACALEFLAVDNFLPVDVLELVDRDRLRLVSKVVWVANSFEHLHLLELLLFDLVVNILRLLG